MSRRGVSLFELVLALVIGAGLSTLLLKTFLGVAARLRDRSERMGLAQSLRTASEALRSGLEDLGADSSAGTDLVGVGSDWIRYRATRLVGIVCDTAASRLAVRVSGGIGSARRLPQPGRDSALVLEPDSAHRWLPAEVLAAPNPASCPSGGAALTLTLSLDSAQRALVGMGSVVRIFETIEARRYSSGGAGWLGLQSISAGETVQPLAGPLAPANGLVVFPETAAGALAGMPGGVEAVRLGIEGITRRDFGVGIARIATIARDSMPAYVFLRNRE